MGAADSHLVLGKHSGKHAVEERCARWASRSSEDLEDLTARFKELADRKKYLYDEDLVALVVRATPETA